MRPTVTVFFDLDGVLADFVSGALAHHGRPDVLPADVGWGIEAQLGMRPAEFWASLGFGFWAGLAPYPDGLALLRAAEKIVGAEWIGLLTSPCDTPGCVDGKRAWVGRHLPAEYRRRLFVGSAKELVAGPGKVLVDDHDPNCARFAAAGGTTVTPPRPWNKFKAMCVGGHLFDVEAETETLREAVRAAAAL